MQTILNTLLMTTMAVAAFGADRKLGFQVEFPFTVGKAVMPAGQYTIERTTPGSPVLTIRNIAEGKSVMLLFANLAQTGPRETKPEIEFACHSNGCSIMKVNQLVAGTSFVHFAAKPKAEQTQLISVKLTPVVARAE